jgi:putative serine protease PepD
VITELNDQLITDSDSLVATVRSYRPGDTVSLTVAESNPDGETLTGETRTVKVTLGSDAD